MRQTDTELNQQTETTTGPQEKTCNDLQNRLIDMADPRKNHGINALAEGMRTRSEYEDKCLALGFPPLDKLLEKKP